MLSRQEVEDSFEAVPAYIVADKRDKFGKRLGRAAFILLGLFFIISSYIQSARNGTQLDESRRERNTLIKSQETIAETLRGQGLLIVQLQETISRQNDALRAAGLPVEPVPNLQDLIDSITKPKPTPTPTSSADPKE